MDIVSILAGLKNPKKLLTDEILKAEIDLVQTIEGIEIDKEEEEFCLCLFVKKQTVIKDGKPETLKKIVCCPLVFPRSFKPIRQPEIKLGNKTGNVFLLADLISSLIPDKIKL